MVGVGVGCRRGAQSAPQVLRLVAWSVAHADDVRQWFRMTYRSAENTGFPLQVTSDGPNQPPTETLTRFLKP